MAFAMRLPIGAACPGVFLRGPNGVRKAEEPSDYVGGLRECRPGPERDLDQDSSGQATKKGTNTDPEQR